MSPLISLVIQISIYLHNHQNALTLSHVDMCWTWFSVFDVIRASSMTAGCMYNCTFSTVHVLGLILLQKTHLLQTENTGAQSISSCQNYLFHSSSRSSKSWAMWASIFSASFFLGSAGHANEAKRRMIHSIQHLGCLAHRSLAANV